MKKPPTCNREMTRSRGEIPGSFLPSCVLYAYQAYHPYRQGRRLLTFCRGRDTPFQRSRFMTFQNPVTLASYDFRYRFAEIAILGRTLIPRTSRLRGSSNAPEARLLRRQDKPRRRYRDSDIEGMASIRGIPFRKNRRTPGRGNGKSIVLPEGISRANGAFDRPLSACPGF